MLFLALMLAAQQPADAPTTGAMPPTSFSEFHSGPRYAQMIAGLCEVALQSGDVRAFFTKNYPQAVASKLEMDVIAADCAIYGFGKAAGQKP